MRDVIIAITAASYSGNKGAAAMLQSSIKQLREVYGERLQINLMSVYPSEDKEQIPFDNIKIVDTKPENLLFYAFPCAILYKLFKWCPPIKKLLLKNKILRAYAETDFVIDEAGISFVDSRGFVMNTYAFVCAAVPLLMGVPVAKYSQALGTFKNPYNRFLAKWILPKLSFIGARGQLTYDNLSGIGIKKNVTLCADGAFSMPDDPEWTTKVNERCAQDDFFNDQVVGISISSVVDKKCTKLGLDYKGTMVAFINALNEKGYHVFLIANAARINSQKSRNNDLMVGDAIYEKVSDQTRTRWFHEEMDAEEIREFIAHCRFLVASRFHAMIGALEKGVPVLLVGWSHKYQEVLDMFELGSYASDFSQLSVENLLKDFEAFVEDEEIIREKLAKNHDQVIASSRTNIALISEKIDEHVLKKKVKSKLFDLNNPDFYIGEHIACRKGYAKDESVRANAASGGMVTALLIHMLKKGEIDGAWVCKTKFENEKLTYDTFIATTEEELRDASSSVYMTIPQLAHLDILREFDGKVAVVMVPCMMAAFVKLLEKEPELKEKVVLKIGLYCSGNHDVKATTLSMKKAGVSPKDADRLYYRRGHWRGQSAVIYKDGSSKTFSYTKLVCAYKNAYFFEKASCMHCKDHYANAADISFGDIWLGEMKKNPIKHSSCVIRTEKALALINETAAEGWMEASYISDRDMVRSQKRALVFKHNSEGPKSRWNHRLAHKLAERNRRYSIEHYDKLEKIPGIVIYYYMCFIRVLLSF